MSGRGTPAWVSLLHRLGMRLLPSDLRQESGPAIRATFEERYRAARQRSWWAAARLTVGELGDLVITAVRVRSEADRAKGLGKGGDGMFEMMRGEFRIAARTLLRKPGYLILGTLTLALGIGANTAVFNVVNSVVLKPLPYQAPEDIVRVWRTMPEFGTTRGPFSFPTLEWSRQNTPALSSWAAVAQDQRTLLGNGPATRLRGSRVSGDFFSLLGVPAALGRGIQPMDDDPDAEPVAVLSHALWMRVFGGDASVVGSRLELEGAEARVVGVMPDHFMGPTSADEYWLPLRLDQEGRAQDTNYLQVIGRLAPGASEQLAASQIAAAMVTLGESNPDEAGRGASIEGLQSSIVGNVRNQLFLLMGAVSLVLFAACANVAGLTLARTNRRHREHAIRLALGSGTRRLALHLMAESAILAVAGGLAGIGVAVGLTRGLGVFGPPMPRVEQVTLGPAALVFLFGATSICVILFGLLPALRGARTPARSTVQGVGGEPGRRNRGQRALAGFQVALAMVLMVGGTLLAKSLIRLQSVDLGFQPDGVLVATLPLEFASNEERLNFVDELLVRLKALGGVQEAGLSWSVPLGAAWGSTRVVAEGSDVPSDQRPPAQMIPTRGDVFSSLGLQLLEGSADLSGVSADDPPTVVINQAFAAALWPGETAVNKRFRRGTNPDSPWTTVMGVVADTKGSSLSESAPMAMYQALTQAGWIQDGQLVIRTADVDPMTLVDPIRSMIAEQDPTLPVTELATLDSRIRNDVAGPRFRAWLVGAFAILVLLVSVIGVYGVMGLLVAGRVRDIGVRIALGATQSTVLLETFWSGAAFTVAGITIGTLGALVLSGSIEALLFNVQARDPLTFVGAAAVLILVTAVAIVVPARRASRVHPMEVLREE